jgi:uncharacterized protein YecA (UPF0149 family)
MFISEPSFEGAVKRLVSHEGEMSASDLCERALRVLEESKILLQEREAQLERLREFHILKNKIVREVGGDWR